MKNLIYSLFFCVLTNITGAQTWQWAFSSNIPNDDCGVAIDKDASGNIYVGVHTSETSNYGNLQLPVKVGGSILSCHSPNGPIKWVREMENVIISKITVSNGNLNLQIPEGMYVVGHCGDGVFYGGTYPDIHISSKGSRDAFIARYDLNGNLNWVQTLGGTTHDVISSAKADLEGNVYVAGNYDSTNVPEYLSNYFIGKYTAFGNLIWHKHANWKGNALPKDMDVDPQGNCYVVGQYNNEDITFGSFDIPATNGEISEGFVVKYDSSGTAKWAQKLGSYFVEPKGTTVTIDGSLYITGAFAGSSKFGPFTLHTNTGEMRRMFLMKMDSGGSILWANDNACLGGLEISSDSNGNIFVPGIFVSPATINIGNKDSTVASAKNKELFVLKYLPTGEIRWIITPGGNDGQGNFAFATVASDSAVYVTGGFSGFTNFGSHICNEGQGKLNMYLAKISTQINTSHVLEVQTVPPYNYISIFPNPTDGEVNLTMQPSVAGIYSLSVINSLGQTVFFIEMHPFGEVPVKIDLSSLPHGIYIISLIEADRSSLKISGRIIR